MLVAAVADEEHASLGVREVLRTVDADAAVVTEPTELELVVAHNGFVWREIPGQRRAHGSRPHLGMDAIVKMGPVLTGLGALDETLGRRENPLLGRGSVHASVIEGGVELSGHPGHRTLRLDRGTPPGDSREDLKRELERGASYWADSASIAAAGIPTVLFGPGGHGAHAAEDWVILYDTHVVARTLAATAGRVCT